MLFDELDFGSRLRDFGPRIAYKYAEAGGPRGRPRITGFRDMRLLVVMAIALVSTISIAQAQEWPAHPVKVIVPYGPGGISDVFGRLTADRLSKLLGKPFIVESRGGAGGALGTEY